MKSKKEEIFEIYVSNYNAYVLAKRLKNKLFSPNEETISESIKQTEELLYKLNNEEKLSDEDKADLTNKIKSIYSIYQEDIGSEKELVSCIKEIEMYDKFSSDLIYSWLNKKYNSPILNYYTLEDLDDIAFIEFEIYKSMKKYKGCTINNLNIYDILKQDARTSIAKKYFGIKEEL